MVRGRRPCALIRRTKHLAIPNRRIVGQGCKWSGSVGLTVARQAQVRRSEVREIGTFPNLAAALPLVGSAHPYVATETIRKR